VKTITVNLTESAYKKLNSYVVTQLLLASGEGISPDTLVAKKILEGIDEGKSNTTIRTKEDV